MGRNARVGAGQWGSPVTESTGFRKPRPLRIRSGHRERPEEVRQPGQRDRITARGPDALSERQGGEGFLKIGVGELKPDRPGSRRNRPLAGEE